ncbi:YheT family hydrolase [Sinobacterium caligoides]|nr:alpha/beta fold hydrolase [Sinobacterium caligoides]
MVRFQAKSWLKASSCHIIDCNGVKMQAFSNIHPHAKGLVQLIHGWEGSAESNYLISAAHAFYSAGYSIFRLNLRDHGHTHHLNPTLFNSTRMDEVLRALAWGQEFCQSKNHYLVGFSLGGNFALRTAADMQQQALSFQRIIAVCPVISPRLTMQTLSNGPKIYHDYFARKWRRSLFKKLIFYPQLGYGQKLKTLSNLEQMNQFFVPAHTDYDDTESYLDGYAVNGDRLQQLHADTHIIAAMDDPVIQHQHLQEVAHSQQLSIELSRYGGHCGFLHDYALNSWLDQRLISLTE